MIVEVCANSVTSASIADRAGAQRIELCQNLMVGGITPSAASIRWCVRQLSLQTFVLIRPRSGDFCYSPLEIELMCADIEYCGEVGVAGVVIGALQPDGQLDHKALEKMMSAARGISVTFHRAFDFTPQPLTALKELVQLGIHRVLTSGQRPTAYEGRHLIAQLVQHAKGQIAILAGGGLHPGNILPLIRTTGVKEIHLSAKQLRSSPVRYADQLPLNQGGFPEHDYYESELEILAEVMRKVEEWKSGKGEA